MTHCECESHEGNSNVCVCDTEPFAVLCLVSNQFFDCDKMRRCLTFRLEIMDTIKILLLKMRLLLSCYNYVKCEYQQFFIENNWAK